MPLDIPPRHPGPQGKRGLWVYLANGVGYWVYLANGISGLSGIPGGEQVFRGQDLHVGTRSVAGHREQLCVVVGAGELAAVNDEACEVVSVEGLVVEPLDGSGHGDLLGDRGAIGPDQIDFWVVGAGPVAADGVGPRGQDARGESDHALPDDGFDRVTAPGVPLSHDRGEDLVPSSAFDDRHVRADEG